ncbi:MAG: hypothetical protein WA665_12535, partial [Pseudolabrys sp.]
MIIKPNPLLAGRGPGNNGKGEHGERLYSPTRPPSKSNTIRADLIGDDRCHALGFTVCAVTPVLALSRRLLAAGYAGATPLEAWR